MAKLLPPPHPILTVIETRTPKQKIHTTLGRALSAFATGAINASTGYTHSWGEVYELKDGQWSLLYTVPPPTKQQMETRPWILDKRAKKS